MKFYKFIKYDITNGIWRKAYLYLSALIICLLFFADFYRRSSLGYTDGSESVTIINFLFYFFAGKEPFSPELGNAFVFPVVWLLIFLFSAYVTLDYPYRNLMGHGIQVIVRVKNRKIWWISKCFWMFFSTIIYFTLLYLELLLLCICFKIDISLHYASYINEEILNIQLVTSSSGQIAMLVFVLPVMTALAVNFIQLCLGLFLDRVYCYLVTSILLFASTYFQSPLAIGNFAMVKRSILCNEEGMTIKNGILINGILIILAIIIGVLRIKKFDIIKTHT